MPDEKIDFKTLDRLASQLRQDAGRGMNLNASAMLSIADIIEQAIGAPVVWPSREAGCEAALAEYPGSNAHRYAFNAGVKWAVEAYSPTWGAREDARELHRRLKSG